MHVSENPPEKPTQILYTSMFINLILV